MLKQNDKINLELNLTNINGEKVLLKQILLTKTVIYFYPKDLTPGCTTEACEFRDYNNNIIKTNTKIIGISSDDEKSHNKFIKKHDLNFELYSDVDHSVQEHFGVWVQKSMYGKVYMGTQRSTFIVNPDGTILKVWDKVNPEGHAKEVLDYLLSK